MIDPSSGHLLTHIYDATDNANLICDVSLVSLVALWYFEISEALMHFQFAAPFSSELVKCGRSLAADLLHDGCSPPKPRELH